MNQSSIRGCCVKQRSCSRESREEARDRTTQPIQNLETSFGPALAAAISSSDVLPPAGPRKSHAEKIS
jgi:hypothetical protein